VLRRLLLDPFDAPFMARALVEVLLLGLVGGVVGVHVLLRRLAFLSEALQHTVFPGIAVAFVIGQSLLVGALVAALVTIVLLGLLARRPRIDPDAALAVLIAGAFALGVVLVSHRRGYQHDLTSLLFGRILAVDTRQLIETAIVTVVCIAVVAALHKELVFLAFDRAGAASLGYRTGRLDLVLNIVVALVVVAAVRALGTVLVVAFLVTPAAGARLVCRSVGSMMVVAVVVALVCGWVGLGLSYEASVHHGVRLASGATVVLTLTAGFALLGAAAAGRAALARPRG
jgi:manganese/iron transport system permease protein